jgi:predicted esterase
MNVAMIGVSATVARGPESFVWAEEAERNAAHIQDALSGLSDRVTIKPGHVTLLGFSQGAQVGFEIAVRHPDEFAGAIALSPGAVIHLQDVKPSPVLARRGFVVCCGAREQPGNVMLTKQDADWARTAKAQVIEREYAGVSAHAFPLDFSKRFPEWVKFIEQTRGE